MVFQIFADTGRTAFIMVVRMKRTFRVFACTYRVHFSLLFAGTDKRLKYLLLFF